MIQLSANEFPRKHPLATDYAYLAGLIDGEGWVGFNKTATGFSPRIQIGMTHLPTLEWCQELFDGHIHDMASRMRGEKYPNAKHSWKWNMSSNAIRLHLPLTLPYMKTKCEQVEILLDVLANWTNKTGVKGSPEIYAKQEELWKAIKTLNQRGSYQSTP